MRVPSNHFQSATHHHHPLLLQAEHRPIPTISRTHTHVHIMTTATLKLLAKELDEAALAVGLVVLLFERALVELLQAEGADKVLRVELLGHGRDAAARDGLLAAGAEGAALLVVVGLAVRLALVVEKASVDERREALSADETLRMPKRVEG